MKKNRGLNQLSDSEISNKIKGLDSMIRKGETAGQKIDSKFYAMKNFYKNELKKRRGAK